MSSAALPAPGAIRCRRCSALAMAAVLLAGCSQTTAVGVSGVTRSQLLLVSAESVNREAAGEYARLLEQARQHHALNRDAALHRRVSAVAQRLIAQLPHFREEAGGWPWEINVISAGTVNAWCMPGGKIVVYTGLIKALELSDDELAVVLGHEMAHALREHTREQASQALLQNGALRLGGLLGLGGLSALGSVVGRYGITLPFSREHESEADEIGLELMALAGFDPEAGPRVWQKMDQLAATRVPELLSTHPGHERRISDLQDLARALRERQGQGSEGLGTAAEP